MRSAVVYEFGAPVDLVDLNPGPIRDFDVLVGVSASGLCHSDLAAHHGTFPVPRPLVIGHEGAGVVHAVGSRVTSVTEGDHVVLSSVISCGRCEFCAKGLPVLCEVGLSSVLGSIHIDGDFRLTDAAGRGIHQFGALGTLSEAVIVPENAVVRIPRDIAMEVACLLGCAVTTGLGAVFNTARPPVGSTIAVVGAGGVGLNVVQAACVAGVYRIIAIDPVEEKRQLAVEFGATETINPIAGQLANQVMEVTGGRGVDFAFECVGTGDLVRQCWDMIARDGTVIAIGVTKMDETVSLPALDFSTTEKRLKSCAYGSSTPSQSIPRYLEMYQAGKLQLEPLIGHRYKLDQLNEAIHELENGHLVGRGIISVGQ